MLVRCFTGSGCPHHFEVSPTPASLGSLSLGIFMWFIDFLPQKSDESSECDSGFIWGVFADISWSSDLRFPLCVLHWIIVNSAPIESETYQTKRQGTGRRNIPSVVFISCTLAVMHAGECWLGLADHSSTERVNRCSVASPNRGDLTCSNLARSLGSCWWSQRKRTGQRKSGGYAAGGKEEEG